MVKCKDCCFWDQLREDDKRARCRRHAPSVKTWPSTLADDWCGEAAELTEPRDVKPGRTPAASSQRY